MSNQIFFEQDSASSQKIIKNYHLLQSQDTYESQKANKFLMSLADRQETWITSQKMIQFQTDPNYIFLGAQLLYQKIERDLHQLPSQYKLNLKTFLFTQLDSNRHQKMFIIDKLASSTALIVCSIFLQQWPNFLNDLLQFMKKSNNHLISGLKILQRIPQQLRMTNRISQGIKNKIQQKFLSDQNLFTVIFNSVFQLNDQNCIISCLKTLQSWIRICYNLMKQPHLVTKILQISTQNKQILQICIKVLTQALKLSQQSSRSGLTQIDPIKQQLCYSQQQIQSLKLVILFIIQHKSNFLSMINKQPQYTQMYVQLIQQLLLSFGFLILESIGFDLLNVVLEITNSYDLKLSYCTFQFWMDYSEKISKLKFSDLTIRENVYNIYVTLFEIFTTGGKKLIIQKDTDMYEADLKDEDTYDQGQGIGFSQYRKQASSLLKYIYDFFVKMKKQAGSQFYFKKVGQLLQSDHQCLNKNTQLALYVLKAPLQSMIQPHQTNYIINILQYLITKINNQSMYTTKNNIPTIVLSETMNFIRDCTKQIKEKDVLFLQALKFVLAYINDQKLCHHAAYCFQVLMQTINTINDSSIAQNLIKFYQENKFTKQVVLQKILQGIFNAIIKLTDKQKVERYLNTILISLSKRYMECSKSISLQVDHRSELYLSLVEIKTILDSYESSNSEFKHNFKQKFIQLANHSVKIVNEILPFGIQSKLRFSNINQIGLTVSIYRSALKIIQVPQKFQMNLGLQIPSPLFIQSLQIIISHVIKQEQITEYYYTITILSQTLVQFINHSNQYLNQWLQYNIPNFCTFFIQYYQNIQKVDTDIIKTFFTVMESLVLYNPNLLKQFRNLKQQVIRMGFHAISQMNEKNMQRKIVSYINLSLQNQVYSNDFNFEPTIQSLFASIPIIHSMCYNILAKIFRHLLINISIQQKQKIFISLLERNPYHQVDLNVRKLLAQAFALAITTEEQRNIKYCFVQLNEAVWKKMANDTLMQLQLKLNAWKRQFKKKKEQ